MPATAKAVARQFVVVPGDAAEFESFLDNLSADVQPEGALEDELFLQLAHAAWTLRRCRLAEAGLLTDAGDPLSTGTNEAKLRMIDAYLRRAQATFSRVMKELRTLQTERQYRVEVQPPDQFPDASETMRSAAALMDSVSINRNLAAHSRRETRNSLREFERSLMAPLFSNEEEEPDEETKPFELPAKRPAKGKQVESFA